MRAADIITIALFDLRASRLRSLLTSLGVIIGVASVTLLLSLGEGVRGRVAGTFADLGTTRIVITPGGGANGPGASTLTLEDAAAIRELPDVEAASAGLVLARPVSLEGGRALRLATVGVESDYFRVSGDELLAGEPGVAGRVVIDQTALGTLFGPAAAAAEAIGRTVELDGRRLPIAGVIADPPTPGGGPGGGSEFSPARTGSLYTELAPLMEASGQGFVSQIQLRAVDSTRVEEVRLAVRDLIERRHGVLDATVVSLARLLERVNEALAVITGFLAALAAISLLVGGIGIMNIMLAVVAERTREIGIIRAFGATRRAVVAQFLAEAVVISLVGGLIGLALASAGAYAIGELLEVPAAPSVGIVALALGASSFVGVLFGVLPAYRAARLDPIRALRHD